ncbi:MAG: class I SAM-dependent methyltransferase [Candidatus Baldrarchaeia archaeon]
MSSSHVFDKYAWKYDSWYVKNKEIFECEFRAVKALGLSGVGIDVGAGTGVFSVKIGVRVGVDPAINMLRIAKERGLDVVRAVGEYLPFRSGLFDYAVMIVTLCFLDDPDPVLREIWKTIRKNGFLAVCIVPKDSLWGKFYIEKARQGNVFYRYAHFYTINEVKEILEKYDFRIVDCKATLSFSPLDKPRVEKPDSNPSGKGFICVKAVKLPQNPIH